jgi:hypothetical protein
MKSSVGENFIARLMSGLAAVLAAIVGFGGAIFLCAKLLHGETWEWALILVPATAIMFAIAVFDLALRKITTYGEHPDDLPRLICRLLFLDFAVLVVSSAAHTL